MERKPEALAAAYRTAMAKTQKIKTLGITADMSLEEQDKLVERLAEIKALENNENIAVYRNGQAWYVDSLVKYAGMSPEERLDYEYSQSFADKANEAEMLEALAAAMAA